MARRRYSFDVTLTATVTLEASSASEARKVLQETVDGASANLGAWPDGSPILCEVGIEGEAELACVEGA